MVSEIQLMEDLYKEDFSDVDFTPSNKYSTDEQLALLAFLLNLQYYYDLYQTMSSVEVYARIDSDIEALKTEYYGKIQESINKGIIEDITDLFDQYKIRHDWFGSNLARRWGNVELFMSSLDSGLNQLRDDIKSKCLLADISVLKDNFNLAPNFRRAVRKITDTVVNNIGLARQVGEREILKFVHGDDQLYNWVCKNDPRTCAICRAKAREEPKKIDEWDLDHPHGRCHLKPVDIQYSEEYLTYLEMYA